MRKLEIIGLASCRRDRVRRLVGRHSCKFEGWEGRGGCGVGSDLTACDYVAASLPSEYWSHSY